MADITYCYCECGNTNCKRNQDNLKEPGLVSVAMLKDTEYCVGWEELTTADVDSERTEYTTCKQC